LTNQDRRGVLYVLCMYGNLARHTKIITWFWYWSFNTSCYLYKDAKNTHIKTSYNLAKQKSDEKWIICTAKHTNVMDILWWCNGVACHFFQSWSIILHAASVTFFHHEPFQVMHTIKYIWAKKTFQYSIIILFKHAFMSSRSGH
jgi:hypothetical protein